MKIKYKFDGRYGGALTDEREMKAIIKSIYKSNKTGNWQAGPEATKMEHEAAKFLGVKYGILTTSGSCAGLLALQSLELEKGSEVIISAVTFPTIFNIILQCGLVPVVVDAKIGIYNFDVDEVERAITKKTKAIIAVHAVGTPCDMPRLMKVAKKYNVKVIEDNCDGWGSTIKGQKVGSFGHVSITSFHAAHIVSMGVGGGVFTNDKNIAECVRVYSDWGRQADTTKSNRYKELPKDYNSRFIYEKIGYNFQILELQAAMGRVQLRKADEIKKLRQKNFNYLYEAFRSLNRKRYFEKNIEAELILPFLESAKADTCWFSFPLTTNGNRGKLTAYLEKHGIETRSMFAGNIIRHSAYKNSKYKIGPDGLTEADYILKHSFWITLHPRLKKSDLDYIIKIFRDYYEC